MKNTKKILLLIAVVVFGYTAQAQKLTFGVKAGVNFSSYNTELNVLKGTSKSKENGSALYFGGLADIAISKKFHVQPELLFSVEGGNNDYSLAFINIPVMAKYYVVEGLSIQAGPQIGFLVSGAKESFVDQHKKTNFSLNVGLGYEIPNSGFSFDARYGFGLTNIANYSDDFVNLVTIEVANSYVTSPGNPPLTTTVINKIADDLKNKTKVKTELFQVSVSYKF